MSVPEDGERKTLRMMRLLNALDDFSGVPSALEIDVERWRVWDGIMVPATEVLSVGVSGSEVKGSLISSSEDLGDNSMVWLESGLRTA